MTNEGFKDFLSFKKNKNTEYHDIYKVMGNIISLTESGLKKNDLIDKIQCIYDDIEDQDSIESIILGDLLDYITGFCGEFKKGSPEEEFISYFRLIKN